MEIKTRILSDGVGISINEKEFRIIFPRGVWEAYPEESKRFYAENLAFLQAINLSMILGDRVINLDTPAPFFKTQLYQVMCNSVPFTADVDGVSTAERLKEFLNLRFWFKGQTTSLPKYDKNLDERAIINMSFGKESLLTFALAEELGMESELLFSVDDDCKIENRYKERISADFSKEFGKNIWKLDNGTSSIGDHAYWGKPKTEWGAGHLITEYTLNTLPLAYFTNAKYILFGNEKSCDSSYINRDGYLSYPVFDQSSEWLLELTRMVQQLSAGQMRIMSLVEPIYELGIMKILHTRYPEIGKYQMSCFPDEMPQVAQNKWCHHCSKCARIFIFMKAHGLDPATLGFKADMLDKEFMNLYSIFGLSREGKAIIGYDASGCNRDEQLYAFYLAYKEGAQGYLIDEFKKKHLSEAREREDELRKKYMGIHDSQTIPEHILKPLLKIYEEELL